MISSKELEKIGFKTNQALLIIKQAKIKLAKQGFELYNNKRVAVVPREAVEDIVGISLSTSNGDQND